jgi:RNA polymerase sigma-70 factor (ECF subfamily)
VEVLYEQYVDVVWRMLERLGVPPSLIEDAVQDTFVVAHRQWGGFRGDSSHRTWLIGIAIRVASDVRRSHRRAAHVESIEVTPGVLDVAGEHVTDEQAVHRQALRRLLAFLEQLPHEQREALVLVDIEQFSAPEAGELLGVSPNTISSRLRLGRARLNALYEEAGR